MALHFHSDYPFLAHPPPQKKAPTQPLPSLPSARPSPAQATRGPCCRSGTFSAIASWAAHVQPGSPASLSPCSAHRHPSPAKGRRSSISSVRAPPVSFFHTVPTPTSAFAPTPSLCDFKPDLTAVGYTSVFLQLPNTPVSAALSLSVKRSYKNAAKNTSGPSTCKPRGFTRFRSLSVVRSRGRPKSTCPDSPTKMKAKAAAAAAAIVKRKKAKYAMRPPPLANELALMQLVDGGNMDDNIKRIMEAQAKASGAVGLDGVYRDGEGGIWRDQDEEWEYTHLLAEDDEVCPHASGDFQWVTFGNTSPSALGILGEDRRGSVSTQDSDLDPKYVVQPVNSLEGDDLALFGSAALPLSLRKPPVSVLSLSSRPRRTAQHLRKPDFLVDVAFSRTHTSPQSPRSLNQSGAGAGVKPKGKARRRPAPLKLSPPSPASKRPTNSPVDADGIRKDFIEASFGPANLVLATPLTPASAISVTTPVEVRARLGNSQAINVPRRTVQGGLTTLGMKKKPSMLNMMGLFRSARKEDMMV